VYGEAEAHGGIMSKVKRTCYSAKFKLSRSTGQAVSGNHLYVAGVKRRTQAPSPIGMDAMTKWDSLERIIVRWGRNNKRAES
jgi:hypothetical protein